MSTKKINKKERKSQFLPSDELMGILAKLNEGKDCSVPSLRVFGECLFEQMLSD